MKYLPFLMFLMAGTSLAAEIQINKKLWDSLTPDEKIRSSEIFKNIEILPSESVGIIKSVQIIDRSTEATYSGAVVGSSLAQSIYIDRAISNRNYSATGQVGMALLGAAIGSAADRPAVTRFILNYSVQTLDGNISSYSINSGDEIPHPIGTCIALPNFQKLDRKTCSENLEDLRRILKSMENSPKDTQFIMEASGIKVNCRIPGGALMTLDRNTCKQLDGEAQ